MFWQTLKISQKGTNRGTKVKLPNGKYSCGKSPNELITQPPIDSSLIIAIMKNKWKCTLVEDLLKWVGISSCVLA